MSDTSLDHFLGAKPISRRGRAFSLVLLILATVAAAALLIRFLVGSDGPYFTAPAMRDSFTPVFTASGTIHGEDEITVGAPQDGVIGAVPVPGQGAVNQGQELAGFDPAPIRRAVLADRAAADEAAAALGHAAIAATETARRLERYESVWHRSGGRVPSLNELDGARAEARKARFDLDAAHAVRDQARRQLAASRARLKNLTVLAPVNGFITSRLVQPGQDVLVDQPLFTIETSLGRLKVVVPLGSAGDAAIALHAKASVLIDGLADRARAATLTEILPEVAGAAGRQAVFTLDQPDSEAHPGMAATIRVELPRREAVLLVPNAALAFDPGGKPSGSCHCLYVLSREGTPRRVQIMAGASDGSRTEVQSGEIEADTKVIIGWRAGTAARP